ncbi:PQQ-dependent sugar dehydrogenase [Pseudoxanthomonas yeongjuensis]|uniref:PQQ-dependent sugar dehydrogenase n=1 Tax=Pseudoxanthomonas yeongjuensis TaxID=377616 RepID=UPI001B87932E|nr:PQQ-dependent sugar dehydrogenase [Pseudoxanthomonas yeongjuensis]
MRLSAALIALLCADVVLAGTDASAARSAPLSLTAHRIELDGGRRFDLQLPAGYTISPALQGLKRVRFFALSPDRRVFATDMHDLGDNRRGVVYILDGWNAAGGRFSGAIPYLTGLRNPNSIAFHVDTEGRQWLYLALTDKLVRYRYRNGDDAPSGEAETVATFPDYGLSYKYGGWHLTRSIAFADNGKLYVSVGSSCNACLEKEPIRASVLEMNPDGSESREYARGLRNAVGLAFIDHGLVATNQGADHLGRDRPEETLYRLEDGADYGWPHCYQWQGRVRADPKFPRSAGCDAVPKALATFPAHSSALGLAYFSATDTSSPADSPAYPRLAGSHLVALHGSTNARLGRGYRVVQTTADGSETRTFIDGFLQGGKVLGRPCGILAFGDDSFLLSDDRRGVVYYVRPSLPPTPPIALPVTP